MTTRTATSIGFTAILLWSLLALLTVLTGEIPSYQSAVPTFQLLAMTFLIGGLIGMANWLKRPAGLKSLRQKPVVWVLGLGGLFGYHALYIAALRLAPAAPAEVGLLNYLWPLLIVLFSSLLPGEYLKRAHIAGALLGFTGVVVLLAGRDTLEVRTEYLIGYGCAVVAAFVWAGYSVLSRRFGQVPTSAVAGFCLATALLSFLCHILFEVTVWPLTLQQWLAILALGVGPLGGAFYVWDIGMKHGDIRLLGIASYAAPVLSTLLLVMLGYDKPTLALAIACGLIVIGALVATVTPKSRS
ncbi:DMT family transporter [Microvirga sp. 17 mud 1-3]|uniref:aromatic amino acid exporter YddG n=1 Tax=Microvirga sp. 17 mud 1-3 TaxID=2082949 RepID=UPI000D6C90E1|nr:EamA family transporter [Microvirga sp. 17 mud 1-3]AWM85789.1 EamA family transporter [Microvirga sp. 17 mud 1-3]